MLEIYAGFDSPKVCQVAFRDRPTNLRIIQAKAKKGKSVKVRFRLLRRFLIRKVVFGFWFLVFGLFGTHRLF